MSSMEAGRLSHFILMNVSFYITSTTHSLKLSGLRQHRCIGLQILGQKSNMGLTGLKIKMSAGLCSFPEALVENRFPLPYTFVVPQPPIHPSPVPKLSA